MKRKILWVLLSLLLLLSVGCRDYHELDVGELGQTGHEEPLIPTDFSFDAADGQSIAHSMSRYNRVGDAVYYTNGMQIVTLDVTTGKTAYLCPDPFCSHDKSCEYTASGIPSTLYAAEDKLFFWQMGSDGADVMVMYDVKTTKLTQLYARSPSPAIVPSLLYHAPYLYHYTVVTEAAEEFEVGDVVLYRYHTEQGEDEALLALSPTGAGFLLGVYGQEIFLTVEGQIEAWEITPGQIHRRVVVSAAALQGGTLTGTPILLADGELRLFSSKEQDGQSILQFWSYSPEQQTLRCVAEQPGKLLTNAFCFTEDTVVFRLEESYTIGSVVAQNAANSGELIADLPNFYLLDYRTGEIRALLQRLPSEYGSVILNREFFVDGNYIYLSYQHYGQAKPDALYAESDFSGALFGRMRIDMRDGTLTYVGGR